LEKNIKVNLEIFITLDGFKTTDLKPDMEIKLEDPAALVCVNRLPFYTGRIKTDENLILCRISRILDVDDAVFLKEKYLI